MNRRHFLKKTAIGTALLGLSGSSAIAASPSILSGKKPKNLIFMVSDGMCSATLRFADVYHQLTQKRHCNWINLYENKIAHRMMIETMSANSIVTDSAAASSAWGIGERVNNGSIGVTPDGREPMPLLLQAREAGKGTGLVSTKAITDATPAGWSANVKNRGQGRDIAKQYLERGYDVMLGGGETNFRDIIPEFKKKGFPVIQTRDELLKLPSDTDKILGLFYEHDMPFYIDKDLQQNPRPSLEEMSIAALKALSKNKNGFFLQIEAASTDMACHSNDAPAALQEQLEFDRTVAVVNDFVKNNPDTLVILTTDHGTGGLNVCGIGRDYNDSTQGVINSGKVPCSFRYWYPPMAKIESRTEMIAYVEKSTGGMKISENRARMLIDQINNDNKNVNFDAITDILWQKYRDYYSTAFTTHNHTGELIEQAVYGPGKEAFPLFLENYKVTHIICELFGLKGW